MTKFDNCLLLILINSANNVYHKYFNRRSQSSSTFHVVLKIEEHRLVRTFEETKIKERRIVALFLCRSRLSLLRIFKTRRDLNSRCRMRKRRRSYRTLNFCERPKITGRRVPDVVEIHNFENRSRCANTLFPLFLCTLSCLLEEDGIRKIHLLREGSTQRSCVFS